MLLDLLRKTSSSYLCKNVNTKTYMFLSTTFLAFLFCLESEAEKKHQHSGFSASWLTAKFSQEKQRFVQSPPIWNFGDSQLWHKIRLFKHNKDSNFLRRKPMKQFFWLQLKNNVGYMWASWLIQNQVNFRSSFWFQYTGLKIYKVSNSHRISILKLVSLKKNISKTFW